MTGILTSSLLAIFLAGYLWIKGAPWYRHDKKYWDVTELFFVYFLWGFGFYVFAVLTFCSFKQYEGGFYPKFLQLLELVFEGRPFDKDNQDSLDQAWLLLFTLFLSVAAYACFFGWRKCCPRFRAFDARKGYGALVQYGGPLAEMLVELAESFSDAPFPVMITLKSRKVYIGTVKNVSSPHVDGKKRSVRLLPLYSGYQSPDKLHYEQDIDYSVSLLIRERINKDKIPKDTVFTFEYTEEGQVKKIPVHTASFLSSYDAGIVLDYEEILSVRLWDKNRAGEFEKNRRDWIP